MTNQKPHKGKLQLFDKLIFGVLGLLAAVWTARWLLGVA